MMLSVPTAIQGTSVQIKEPQSAAYVQQGTSVEIKEPPSAAYVQRENGAIRGLALVLIVRQGNGEQRGLALAIIVRQGNGVREEPPSVASVQQVISQLFSVSQS